MQHNDSVWLHTIIRLFTNSISLKKMKEMAQAALDALDFPDGELSILIIDDRQIEEFNRNYIPLFPIKENIKTSPSEDIDKLQE